MNKEMNEDVICAISTPPGMGAIAVVRLSGEGAIALADTIFISPSGKKLTSQQPNTVHFGRIYEGKEIIDEVLVTLFHAPHSFTGEESVEISCHGSLYIQQKIIELLLSHGARMAEPGEFTRRAFRNGKFDLSQAEAVADLIASTSQVSHRVAMNQMRGGFSQKLNELREELLQFVSLVELELDFSEEDVEFADRRQLHELTEKIETDIEKLANSFKLGNAIKKGIPVAIIGETNAGKSTLLNALLNEEKAIVSDIHGTTRDAIEDTVNIGGIVFRFIDTAGIRQTSDTLENIGIERTFKKMEQASIVLWVIDLTAPEENLRKTAEALIPKLNKKQVILLFNKADLLSPEESTPIQPPLSSFPKAMTKEPAFSSTQKTLPKQHLLPELKAERLFISAKTQQNIDQLQSLLVKMAHIPQIGENDVIVTNLRHYEALKKALEAIRRVKKGLNDGISGDFLSQDIRECMFYLGEITGQITTDEILGNIFSHFCIGK
jgi:tRNA modification GTPase